MQLVSDVVFEAQRDGPKVDLLFNDKYEGENI